MSNPKELNKKKLEFLRLNGINVKVDGSWGPWQEEQYKKLTTKDKHYQTTPLGYLSYLYDKAFGETTYLEDPDYVKGYSGELTEDTRSTARRWVDTQMKDNKTPLGYAVQTVAPAAAVAAATVYGAPYLVNGVTKGIPLLWNGVRTAVTNPSTIMPAIKTGANAGLLLGKTLGKEALKAGVGMAAVNGASKVFTGKTWGENMAQSTGMSPELGELTNPGAYGPTYLKNVAKRGVETAMRTTTWANPIEDIVGGIKEIITHDPKRAASIGNYILTGTQLGSKGYYNSLRPDYINYYTGFMKYTPPNYLPENDLIDAFLYKKPISTRFGVKKLNTKDYGVHTDYVKKYYPDKDILVYEILPGEGIPITKNIPEAPDIKKVTGSKFESPFNSTTGWTPNVAGHLREHSYDLTAHNMIRALDIWKFNPDEYMAKWGHLFPTGNKANLLAKLGLKTVNHLGTPVIIRTKWFSDITPLEELNAQRELLGLPTSVVD